MAAFSATVTLKTTACNRLAIYTDTSC